MPFKRIWFDYPIHRIDECNFLASANYAESGNGGVGKDQKEKSDWYQIADDVISLKDPDTCATPDEIGITASNSKTVFNANKTDWMTATLQDGTVVIAKKRQRIIYQGKPYEKGPKQNSRWLRVD
jgi:hypothetical protein